MATVDSIAGSPGAPSHVNLNYLHVERSPWMEKDTENAHGPDTGHHVSLDKFLS